MTDDKDWATLSASEIRARFFRIAAELMGGATLTDPTPDAFVVPDGPIKDEVRRMIDTGQAHPGSINLDTLAMASANVAGREVGGLFSHVPVSYEFDPMSIGAAKDFGKFARANYEAQIDAMRASECARSASTVIESTTSDGLPMLLVMPSSELALTHPIKVSWDIPAPRVEFNMINRLGGVDVGRRPRMLEVLSLPMPRGPGVEAMLADGWAWTGVEFARDPVARYPWRYAGHIEGARVLAGRYADRLPTNRKRKRQAAKARRRLRLREYESAARGPGAP